MSSSMTFATLQEAWGVPAFVAADSAPVSPPATPTDAGAKPNPKSPAMQRSVLEQTQTAQNNLLYVTAYIRQAYKQQGAAGVLGLMDADIAKAVRSQSLLTFDWLDADALLLGFLFACALWLCGDALKRKP